MASGAGVNTVGNIGGIPILVVPPGATTPVAVVDPEAGYGTNSGPSTPVVMPDGSWFPMQGTIGTDSGLVLLDAKGFTKWTFQIIGPGKRATGTASFGITILGTIDPAILARSYQTPGNAPGVNVGIDPTQMNSLTAIPATSWDILPMQAVGTTVVDSNPLITGANTIGFASGALVAVRAVLTGTAPTTGTAGITVLAFAVP